MSNLEKHALEEMRRAGLYDEDADYGPGVIAGAVMELVKAHSAQHHSGSSHHLVLDTFKKVVNFKTLSPITSDPSEWFDVSEASGRRMWQSKRQPSLFSTDGGATWYDLDDPAEWEKSARRVFLEVLEERARQVEKWGQQDLPDGTGESPAHPGLRAMAVQWAKEHEREAAASGTLTFLDVMHEEVAEAFAESDKTLLRAELLQVIAVGFKWIEKLDREAGR